MVTSAHDDARSSALVPSSGRLELGDEAVVENCLALREFGMRCPCEATAGRYACPQRALCDRALRSTRRGPRQIVPDTRAA